MMAMDGSGGNVDMYASPLPVSSLNDRNRLRKKAREAKTDLDSIPSAATTTGMHSFLLCWAEQIIDADRLMRRQYELTIRQEPRQARICGIDGKGVSLPPVDFVLLTLDKTADSRPIDPPVIVQLRIIDPAASFILFLPPCSLLFGGVRFFLPQSRLRKRTARQPQRRLG
ncbi:hypothetical protein K438DRAFT_882241 [Mycena galopus ATCC 62051]|nr:hypothetical protein K438DRAFT_882241 [Mycena galopus ATCC 62051]